MQSRDDKAAETMPLFAGARARLARAKRKAKACLEGSETAPIEAEVEKEAAIEG